MVVSVCFSSMLSMKTAILRGVPKSLVSRGNPMRRCLRPSFRSFPSPTLAGFMNRAGSSSHPISRRRASLGLTALEEGKTEIFPFSHVEVGAHLGEVPYPGDVIGPLGNTYCAPRIEQVEGVGAFQAVVVGGVDKLPALRDPLSFGLITVEEAPEQSCVRLLEVVGGILPLGFKINVPIEDPVIPFILRKLSTS